MSEGTETGLNDGQVQYIDHCLPSLDAGIYDIILASAIEDSNKKDVTNNGNYFKEPLRQRFEVRAPQFHLEAADVHAVYPPNNSNGIYGGVLPHIVLNTRLLPWERLIDPKAGKTTPWLALLVFKEGEIAIDASTNSSLRSISVSAFLEPGGDVIKPAIGRASVAQDVLQSQCQSIRISADAFKALTPRLVDLPYLAHVRKVNTDSQVNADAGDRGWFSVVVGNRLPVADNSARRYYVHLVSLEGFCKYLADTPGTEAGDDTKKKDFQLVSLYNWSFVSQAQPGESFAELATNFVKQAGDDPGNLLLRRQVPQPQNPDAGTTAALKRVREGYTALTYQTPSGEESFAWYRGPLMPVVAQDLPRPGADYHYPSASSAMIYDRQSGIFDQSYAAAWTIGRMLALADGKFAQMLYACRRRSHQLLGRLVDNHKRADYLKSVGRAEGADLNAVPHKNTARSAFDQMLSKDPGARLTNILRNKVVAEPAAVKARRQVTVTADPVSLTRQFLQRTDVQRVIWEEQEQDLKPIADWLARKQLLYDVPFNHLVPDQFMLPVESLRFFYVDQNWLDVLTDGALSIGIQSSGDAFITLAMRGTVSGAVTMKIKSMRSKLLGTANGDVGADSTKEDMSGILIRSALVAGWPGLVIKAYKGGSLLKTLRMDRLSANVLLCLFEGIPDTVTLSEPEQGLRFGVEDGDIITLRQLSGTDVGKPIAGRTFPSANGFKQFYRDAVNGIGGTVLTIKKIVEAMQQKDCLNQEIGSAAFAIEMVKAPEQLLFKLPTSDQGKG